MTPEETNAALVTALQENKRIEANYQAVLDDDIKMRAEINQLKAQVEELMRERTTVSATPTQSASAERDQLAMECERLREELLRMTVERDSLLRSHEEKNAKHDAERNRLETAIDKWRTAFKAKNDKAKVKKKR